MEDSCQSLLEPNHHVESYGRQVRSSLETRLSQEAHNWGNRNAAKRRWSRSGGLGQRGQFGHGPRVFNSRGLAVKSQEVQSVAPTLYGFDFEHAKDAFTGRARRDEELVSTVDAVSPKTASRGPQSNQFGSLWSPRSKLMEALRETKREQRTWWVKRMLWFEILMLR